MKIILIFEKAKDLNKYNIKNYWNSFMLCQESPLQFLLLVN